jgi:hypothetical protein
MRWSTMQCAMPEPYTLIEYKLIQSQTMQPSPGRQSTWLHAAIDSDDGGITVACSYKVSELDVPKRDLSLLYDGY